VKWLDASTLDVKKHLYAKGFTADESSPLDDLEDLAMILLRIAADANSVLTADACRAVAILLERRAGHEVINNIAGDVRRVLGLVEQLIPDPHELQDGGDQGAAGELRTAAEMLTSAVEQQCHDMWELTGRLEEEVTQVVKRVKEAVVENAAPCGQEGGEERPELLVPTARAGASYAAVAGTRGAAPPLPQHAVAVANARAKDCQILIDRSPVVGTNNLENLSEKELVVKANWALTEAIKALGEQAAPERVVFVGAQRVRSGAIVFHLNTAAAAEWIRTPRRMSAFLAKMGGTSIFKPRSFSVVVEFVPVSFNPDLGSVLGEIEECSGIEKGGLIQARFIKPVARRMPGQRCAHAIFGFSSAEAANHAIRHSLFVEGKRVSARKLLAEPIRCLKCQRIGVDHVAATCRHEDVCARCGEAHRTDTCRADDKSRGCSNCKAEKRQHWGHGAADRNCPVFMGRLQFALERNPEAKYRYFPTDDPSTWERTDTAAADINNQQATWQDGNKWGGGYAMSNGRTPATGSNSLRPGLPAPLAAANRTQMGAGSQGRMRQTRLDEGLGERPPAVVVGMQEQANGENTSGGQMGGEGTAGQRDEGEDEDTAQVQVQAGNGKNREEDEEDEVDAEEAIKGAARLKRREASKAAAQEMDRAIATLVLSGDGEEFSPGTPRAGLPQLRGEEDRTPPRGIASRSTPRGRPVDGAE
jgi:hypothetical protein